MHGIFALQDEITRSIVDTLKLKLAISPSAPPRSTDAYDDYLHGLFYSDKSTEERWGGGLNFLSAPRRKNRSLAAAGPGLRKHGWCLRAAIRRPLEAIPKFEKPPFGLCH